MAMCDWFSPAGDFQCRIDYVAIPNGLASRSCASSVLSEFDTLLAVVDHLPVVLSIRWVADQWRDLPQRRRPVMAKAALANPEACSRFEAALEALPLAPAAANIHDHLALTLAGIRAAAASAFPLAEQPKKPHTQNTTKTTTPNPNNKKTKET